MFEYKIKIIKFDIYLYIKIFCFYIKFLIIKINLNHICQIYVNQIEQ